MKALTIRVSDELHKKIKIKTVIEEETTIQDYIVGLIKKDLGIDEELKNK